MSKNQTLTEERKESLIWVSSNATHTVSSCPVWGSVTCCSLSSCSWPTGEEPEIIFRCCSLVARSVLTCRAYKSETCIGVMLLTSFPSTVMWRNMRLPVPMRADFELHLRRGETWVKNASIQSSPKYYKHTSTGHMCAGSKHIRCDVELCDSGHTSTAWCGLMATNNFSHWN